MTPGEDDKLPAAVIEAAAAWFMRLKDEALDTEARARLKAELDAWLAEDEAHRPRLGIGATRLDRRRRAPRPEQRGQGGHNAGQEARAQGNSAIARPGPATQNPSAR